MGALARKSESESSSQPSLPTEGHRPPTGPQGTQVLAVLVALPGAVAVSLATCLLGMWAVHGGSGTAWVLLGGAWSAYGLAALLAIGASFLDRS